MTGARLPSLELGPEWAMLELLCPGRLRGERRDMFLQLLRAGIDEGQLVEQAMRHRMLPMLAYVMADEEIAGCVLHQLRGELVGVLLANRRRNATLARVAATLCSGLRAAGIRVAVTKGVALEQTIYGGHGCRKMMDVDLMIHPRHRADVRRLMTEAGFVNGIYEWREDRIRPLPKRTLAMYRLSPDHLPHFLKLDADGAGAIAVDVACSVTWSASEQQLDQDEALAELVDIPALGGEVELPTLNPAYQFLFTALHLYREAWFQESVERGKDMLYKFADLLRLWSRYSADLLATLPGVIERYNLPALLGWVLTHTDRIFGTTMAADLKLPTVSEEQLAGARGLGGVELTWTGSMRERLHSRDRMALFTRCSTSAATY